MRKRVMMLGLAVLAASGVEASAFETIGRSDPLRKTLLDSMRPTIEAYIGTPVQFVVDTLQIEDGWAFFAGTPQHKDGSPIDFMQTRYAEAMEQGMFDRATLKVLLEQNGKRWNVVSFSIGATDVVEAGWPDEYGVPCQLVEYC